MKLLQKIVVLTSILSMVLFSSNRVLAQEDRCSQDEAYEAYLAMSEALNFRMDMVSERYPDYFGGCYLENDILVVLITKDNPEIRDYYLNACGNSDKVIFRCVENTYEELLSLEEIVVPQISQTMRVYESFVDVTNNTFCVGVDSQVRTRVVATSALESSMTDLPVTVYQIEEIPKANAMQGGEGLKNGTSPCSICFFGTYNGKDALVTSGHANSVGSSMKYNGTTIGKVVLQNLKLFEDIDGLMASYGDFSIVDISNSSIDGSDKVKTASGSVSATGTANLIAGMTVKMYGKESICISGTVKSTSATITYLDPETYESIKVKGLATIEAAGGATTVAGDSGGCVVYTAPSGVNRIAGCITGSKGGVCSYVTPISYIEDKGFEFN